MRQAVLFLMVAAGLAGGPVLADPPKTEKTEKPAREALPLPTGYLSQEDWLQPATTALEPGEIDRLVEKAQRSAGHEPAPLTTDEQFIRRVTLDLTGKLPLPADVTEFLADGRSDKRARFIDRLLDSEDYARHWGSYWRNVIASRVEALPFRQLDRGFETWITEQIRKNRGWGAVTRDILTATGSVEFAKVGENGQAYFLLTRRGADKVTEIAAETSRIFLGIQIQCAQCHDHPSDVWKREQFHQFAAYFARTAERPIRDGQRITGVQLVSRPFGEHRMPDKDNPRKGTNMSPKFLDGKGPANNRFLNDERRRGALADAIVSKNNPYFAGAYVNRLWGELMGQAFYQPIDDMGPEKEAFMPEVLARVAASFRGSDYDTKQLLRDILNSKTYQRQLRPGDAGEPHLLFTTRNPLRLNADALWESLVGVLGKMNVPRFGGRGAGGPFAGRFGLEGQFKQEFAFDPSTRPSDIEGTVSQALLLMNNPQLQEKVKARGTNVLARILSSYADDGEALKMVYLRTLARRPTDRELARCRQHLSQVGNRAEAYEDILWALINSTEFQTRR